MSNFKVSSDLVTVEVYSVVLDENFFPQKGSLISTHSGNETFTVDTSGRVYIDIVPLPGITITNVPDVEFGQPWAPIVIEFSDIGNGVWEYYKVEQVEYSYTPPDPIEILPATTGEVIESVTPYNRLYMLDGDTLETFANEPLATYYPNGSDPIIITYGDFITKLLQIPYKIPSEYLNTAVNIIIGDYDTEIPAPPINNDEIEIKLAEFPAVSVDENILDVIATSYELYLPFIKSPIELEPSEIVNKSITVFMVLDAYSGSVTINVYTDETKPPILSTQDNIARELQTQINELKVNNSLYGSLGEAVIKNGFTVPYLKIIKEVLESGKNVNLVKDSGVLGDSIGYVTVDYCEIGFTKTLGDYEELNNILSNGVIIK